MPDVILSADLRLQSTTTFERQIKELERKTSSLRVDSQPLGRLSARVTEFDKSIEAANARVLAFGASAAVIGSVAGAIKEMVTQTIKVQKSLTDINVLLNLSSGSLSKFGNELFNVAKNTGQSFDEVAKAATEFSRQGLGVEEILKRTQNALILTRLSGLDAAKSVETLTATVNSFQKEALDTTTIINKLANVDAKFAVGSKDLAEGLSRAGAAAQDVGVNFDQLAAFITTAQQKTARGGAVIGNALKSIFTRVNRSDTLDELEKLGVGVRDLEGKALPTEQIMISLAKSFDTLGASQKSAIAEMVGGIYQINILKSITGDLTSKNSIYSQALKTSSSAQSEAIERNQALNKSLSALANSASQNFSKLAAQFGQSLFGPSLERVFGQFNDFADNIDGKGIGEKIGKGLLDGIGNALSGPGIILAATIGTKLLAQFSKFGAEAVGKFANIGGQSQEVLNVQQGINALLSQRPNLEREIVSGAISEAEAQQKILSIIREQIAAQTLLAETSQRIAISTAESGVKFNPFSEQFKIKNKAIGHVPIAQVPAYAIQQEVMGAAAAGYTISPSNVRAMRTTINGSPTTVVYNNKEKIIENFAGTGEPAIIPPNKNVEDLQGFSGGFKPPRGSKEFVLQLGQNPSSKLTYEIKGKTLNILDTESHQKGDAYANFKGVAKIAKDKGLRVKSDYISAQKDTEDLFTNFPQIRHRDGLSKTTKGVLSVNNQEVKFKSLNELKQVFGELPSAQKKRADIFDLEDTFAAGGVPIGQFLQSLGNATTPENSGFAKIASKSTRGATIRNLVGLLHPEIKESLLGGDLKRLLSHTPANTLKLLIEKNVIQGVSPAHVDVLTELQHSQRFQHAASGFTNIGGRQVQLNGLQLNQLPRTEEALIKSAEFLKKVGLNEEQIAPLVFGGHARDNADVSQFSPGTQGVYHGGSNLIKIFQSTVADTIANVRYPGVLKSNPEAGKRIIDKTIGKYIAHESFHNAYLKNKRGARDFVKQNNTAGITIPKSSKEASQIIANKYYGGDTSKIDKKYKGFEIEEALAIHFPKLLGFSGGGIPKPKRFKNLFGDRQGVDVRTENNSILRVYPDRKNKQYDINYIESAKKGDAFKIFNATLERARKKGYSVYSGDLVQQAVLPSEVRGLSNSEKLLKQYPQIRYRKALANNTTSGQYLYKKKTGTFSSIPELENFANSQKNFSRKDLFLGDIVSRSGGNIPKNEGYLVDSRSPLQIKRDKRAEMKRVAEEMNAGSNPYWEFEKFGKEAPKPLKVLGGLPITFAAAGLSEQKLNDDLQKYLQRQEELNPSQSLFNSRETPFQREAFERRRQNFLENQRYIKNRLRGDESSPSAFRTKANVDADFLAQSKTQQYLQYRKEGLVGPGGLTGSISSARAKEILASSPSTSVSNISRGSNFSSKLGSYLTPERAFAASFAIPLAGGVASEFFSNPQLKRGTTGATNALGSGLALGAAFGGAPGAIIGGLVGSFGALKSVVDNLKPSLEDLNEKFAKAREERAKPINALGQLGEIQNNLANGANLNKNQLNGLFSQRRAALNNLDSTDRKELTKNNFDEKTITKILERRTAENGALSGGESAALLVKQNEEIFGKRNPFSRLGESRSGFDADAGGEFGRRESKKLQAALESSVDTTKLGPDFNEKAKNFTKGLEANSNSKIFKVNGKQVSFEDYTEEIKNRGKDAGLKNFDKVVDAGLSNTSGLDRAQRENAIAVTAQQALINVQKQNIELNKVEAKEKARFLEDRLTSIQRERAALQGLAKFDLSSKIKDLNLQATQSNRSRNTERASDIVNNSLDYLGKGATESSKREITSNLQKISLANTFTGNFENLQNESSKQQRGIQFQAGDSLRGIIGNSKLDDFNKKELRNIANNSAGGLTEKGIDSALSTLNSAGIGARANKNQEQELLIEQAITELKSYKQKLIDNNALTEKQKSVLLSQYTEDVKTLEEKKKAQTILADRSNLRGLFNFDNALKTGGNETNSSIGRLANAQSRGLDFARNKPFDSRRFSVEGRAAIARDQADINIEGANAIGDQFDQKVLPNKDTIKAILARKKGKNPATKEDFLSSDISNDEFNASGLGKQFNNSVNILGQGYSAAAGKSIINDTKSTTSGFLGLLNKSGLSGSTLNPFTQNQLTNAAGRGDFGQINTIISQLEKGGGLNNNGRGLVSQFKNQISTLNTRNDLKGEFGQEQANNRAEGNDVQLTNGVFNTGIDKLIGVLKPKNPDGAPKGQPANSAPISVSAPVNINITSTASPASDIARDAAVAFSKAIPELIERISQLENQVSADKNGYPPPPKAFQGGLLPQNSDIIER